MNITKKIQLALVGALSVGATAASQAKPAPPLLVRYEWRNGTVAPPYHYEYTISLGPSARGRMILTPGYPRSDGKSKTYTASFAFPPAARQKLLATMQARHVFDGAWAEATGMNRPIGGGSENLEVTLGGRKFVIPAFLNTPQSQADASAVYAAINALVPKAARAKLMAEQQMLKAQG